MFPICGSNSRFTYDNLHEIGLDPLWTTLAAMVATAFLVVIALTVSGQPPVQADLANADTAFVASVETDHADEVIAEP